MVVENLSTLSVCLTIYKRLCKKEISDRFYLPVIVTALIKHSLMELLITASSIWSFIPISCDFDKDTYVDI